MSKSAPKATIDSQGKCKMRKAMVSEYHNVYVARIVHEFSGASFYPYHPTCGKSGKRLEIAETRLKNKPSTDLVSVLALVGLELLLFPTLPFSL
jgi:hypothetical protein